MTQELAGYIFFGLVGLIFFLSMQRWFLAIDGQLKNQRIMIAFLIRLLRQQGVDEKEIEKMKESLKISD